MTDTLGERFGKRCRLLRTRKKLSQLDMVRRIDIDLRHYQRIESGTFDVRISTAKKLAECFGVSFSVLVKGL